MSEPTKVETLADVFPGTARVRVAARTILENAGLLTARIIPGPVCKTCRGSGLRQDLPYEGDPRCPACHGEQLISIVTAEAREAVILVLHPNYHATAGRQVSDEVDKAAERAADRILTALGPFVVADEVVTVVRRREECETVYHDEWYEYLGRNPRGQKVIQRSLGGMMHDGDCIYIKRRESEEVTSDE